MRESALSFNIDEAAKLTGLGKTRLYQELKSGRLRGVKSGKRTLIPRTALEEWLENLQAYPVCETEN